MSSDEEDPHSEAEEQDVVEESERWEEQTEREDSDDDAPVEVTNARQDFDAQDASATEPSKRKRKRVRKVVEKVEDDVLERAKAARLERELRASKLIKEFNDEAVEDDEEAPPKSKNQTAGRIQVVKLSKDRAAAAKLGMGAMEFSKHGLLGISKVKRISLQAYRSQKIKGPALEFRKHGQ